jgi:predicted Zn-dependent protease
MLYDANRYADCEQAFLPLTVLDPDKSPGWAMAGLCEFEVQHYGDAVTHLRKAEKLGLPPSLFDVVHYHLVLALLRAGDFDAVSEIISRAAVRGEDTPQLQAAMGLAGLRRAQLPQDVPPADRELVSTLGKAMCDAAASRAKQAVPEFEALVSKFPSTPELHYLYGLVLLETDPDRALVAFSQELKLFPKNTRALISTAAEYEKRGEYSKALPYADEAVRLEPKYFATHAILGKVLTEGGVDLQRGTKELETAVKMAPANPQSRLALASAYAKAGRSQDAAKQRAEFLQLRQELDANAASAK